MYSLAVIVSTSVQANLMASILSCSDGSGMFIAGKHRTTPERSKEGTESYEHIASIIAFICQP